MSSTRLFSLVALVLASCASTGAPTRGHLVIVGGGLRADNTEVFRAFVDGAGERVVVLPTASGVPLESGAGTIEDLERHASPAQTFEVVEILSTQLASAEDATNLETLRRADAVWFTGGVQSRITAAFRPSGLDSSAYGAVVDVLRRGGRVAGSSAGAAMMSDPMIRGGSSREALVEGATDSGFGLEQGMGLFRFGIVDQHFLRRGRIGRLVVALELAERRFGFGVADDRALAVDLAQRIGHPLGERAVVLLDAKDAERVGNSRLGLRIALLSSGDTVDLRSGTVVPADDKELLHPIDDLEPRQHDELRPFAAETATMLLERLSADPKRPQRASEGGIALVVRADENTRFYARDGALRGFTAIGAILDIEVDADAPVESARRR